MSASFCGPNLDSAAAAVGPPENIPYPGSLIMQGRFANGTKTTHEGAVEGVCARGGHLGSEVGLILAKNSHPLK